MHHHLDLSQRERLRQVVERAQPDGLDGRVERSVPSNDHHIEVRIDGLGRLQHLETVGARHDDVREDQPVPIRVTVERGNGRPAVLGRRDLQVHPPKELDQQVAHIGLVVDHEHLTGPVDRGSVERGSPLVAGIHRHNPCFCRANLLIGETAQFSNCAS